MYHLYAFIETNLSVSHSLKSQDNKVKQIFIRYCLHPAHDDTNKYRYAGEESTLSRKC